MSKDAVDKFYEQMAGDEGLQKAYTEAMDCASAEAVAGFASSNGFDFTVDELVESWSSQAAELSEEDLEGVAGGGMSPMMMSLGSGFRAAMMVGPTMGGMIAGMSKCDKCTKIMDMLMKKCEGKCGKLG